LSEAAPLELSDSGTSVNSSFDPETFNCGLPFATTIVPATITTESLIVNPFFVMASCNCFSVVELSDFIFTDAKPFVRLTSTESTPDTDFNDTRTAWAQTSQSMPKIVTSMDLISADADATYHNNDRNSTLELFISSDLLM
jgi:hypothetical protein